MHKLTIGLLVSLFFLPSFQLWGALESSIQQVAVAEKGLELALKELTFARDRFTAGLGTNIEATNAQTSVARARDNEIEALFRFNASRINLARAKGEIEKLF